MLKRNVLYDLASSVLSRKEQFDSYEHMKTDIHPIRLVIAGDTTIKQTQLFIPKVKSSFVQSQLTCLNINCHSMTITSLVEIIRLLPHLHFLEISSLPNLHSNSSSVQDIKTQLLVSVMNKIIKVKLNKFTEQKQIQFLINLCSRMQYLEVDCMSNTDLGMLIKYILINQVTHTPDLGFVCLNVPNANQNMVQNLAMIIDLETLVNNYTVQRTGDKIFLQWKLE